MGSLYLHLYSVVLSVFIGTCSTEFSLSIVLNTSDVRGPVHPFWKSTGFCPPKPHQQAANFDLSNDMVQNLAFISAVPYKGIEQIRIHWLLDLVKVERLDKLGPVYNFTKLDSFVELLHENELTLGFELMGNPSQVFTDFENRTQVFWWRDLVTLIGKRYINRHGLSYVQKWNFETWNEPDCHDFDTVKFTIQGFLNYYDACSEGLLKADKSLTFGGPGDGCWPDEGRASGVGRSRKYADALFNHTIRGKNYFTGETGVRLDFISLHKKGEGQGSKILEKEISAAKYLEGKYPELLNTSFYNDEADLLVGWSKPQLWRANAVYAALVAKVIAQHQNILKSRPDSPIKNYKLLSNDNAFLSFYPNQFTQRTLLARFQVNKTRPGYTTFVRKPVYIVMGMMALLGDRQLHLDIPVDMGEHLTNSSDFGALATLHDPGKGCNSSDSWQVTILIYGASDPGKPTDFGVLDLQWDIDPPKDVKSLKLMTSVIYNGWGNAYYVWAGLFNKTDFPSLEQFDTMREQEHASGALYDVPVEKGKVPIPPMFQVLDPHIIVLHLCAQPSIPPEKVTGLRFVNVTMGQVLVVWSWSNVKTKCILTFEVEFSLNNVEGSYTRVNKFNTVASIFPYETDSEKKVRGFYRVRAVDYWNTKGDYSDPMIYGRH